MTADAAAPPGVGQHRGVSEPVVSDKPSPAGGAPESADAHPGAKRDHGPLKKTVRDIALSMGVVAGIIFLVLLVTWRPQPDPIRAIDPVPVAQRAAVAADYPVLLPQVGLDWRATSARFEPTAESDQLPVWFNGWVTPAEQYVAVIQSGNTTESFIEEQTIDALPAGPDAPSVPGWEAMVSPSNGQRSLVKVDRGATTIVTGSVDWTELVAFQESLAPVAVSGP